MFDAIFYRKHPRVNVIAPTQDGKSLTIASAVTLVACFTDERFTIVAPSEKKADIIMSEVRELATQHPLIYSQLELDKGDTLSRLKRERSKRHLTFKRGGGIMTLTLDARNGKRNIESAMGFGSKNIIADEAGLISDPLWATVVRMLGGDFKEDKRQKLLIKVGNPFYRNHFYRSSISDKYLHIKHDWRDSLRDYEAGFYGYSPDMLAEARDEAFFDVFYECNFPDEDLIDINGYRQLVKLEDIKQQIIEPIGEPKLGVDIGGGSDLSVYVVRWDNYAMIKSFNQTKDTMVNVVEVENIMEELGISAENVSLDDIGVGRGVSDRLKERGHKVNGVSVGDSSREKTKFANLKAELNWKAGQWLKTQNCVMPSDKWEQATWVKYKVNTDRSLKIESKEELKKRTGKSPDFWDAFALTFYEPPISGIFRI